MYTGLRRIMMDVHVHRSRADYDGGGGPYTGLVGENTKTLSTAQAWHRIVAEASERPHPAILFILASGRVAFCCVNVLLRFCTQSTAMLPPGAEGGLPMAWPTMPNMRAPEPRSTAA